MSRDLYRSLCEENDLERVASSVEDKVSCRISSTEAWIDRRIAATESWIERRIAATESLLERRFAMIEAKFASFASFAKLDSVRAASGASEAVSEAAFEYRFASIEAKLDAVLAALAPPAATSQPHSPGGAPTAPTKSQAFLLPYEDAV